MSAKIILTGATGLVGFRVLVVALTAGHAVCCTVRSEEKAQIIKTNPAIQDLSPGDRLTFAIIPDLTTDGVFDSIVQGATHIIHTGSPVPMEHFDPKTDIFEPTIKMSLGLLHAALKSPSVKKVVITSSAVANIDLAGGAPGPEKPSVSTRLPLPDPFPETFSNVYEAYQLGKIVELHNSDTFAKAQHPHFTISHIAPGYIFGRNELALDTDMLQTQNSSNNYLVANLLGGDLPFPLLGGFTHLEDTAEIHLRVALEEGLGGKDFGIVISVNYDTIFDYVAKAFPKAVEAGVFKKGVLNTIPVDFDSSDAETLLGQLRSFEAAVVDVAGQYLEKAGKEKA